MPVYAILLIQEHTLRLRDTTPIFRNHHNTVSTVKSKKYTSYPSFLGQGNVFGSGTRYAVLGHSAMGADTGGDGGTRPPVRK